jgi:hypothetical protein
VSCLADMRALHVASDALHALAARFLRGAFGFERKDLHRKSRQQSTP